MMRGGPWTRRLPRRALGHINTLGQVLATAGTMLAQMNRDAAACEAHLRAALLLEEEHQLGQWHAYNTYDQGWLLAQREAYADGIAQMQAGLDQLANIGIGLSAGNSSGDWRRPVLNLANSSWHTRCLPKRSPSPRAAANAGGSPSCTGSRARCR